jgi:hypothetical protein
MRGGDEALPVYYLVTAGPMRAVENVVMMFYGARPLPKEVCVSMAALSTPSP